MTFGFYYQAQGGEDAWQEGLASARTDIIAKRKPRFVTVLDLSPFVSDGMSKDDIEKIHYIGPWYADFDAPDIDTAITKVKQLAEKLIQLDVDPNAVRWFATGGRGFHVEVPIEFFLPKIPAKGIQHLPLLFREVTFELYVDTMDLRVYSARRGRMWRTPGVQRENLAYKVPITHAELLAMTPESYKQLCSAPRPAPELAAPAFNADMALLFEKARMKVDAGVKKRKDSSAQNVELIKRFKGAWPPSLVRIMQGEVAADKGFHQIAMQLAIVANALGKSEADTLAAADGLIQNHVSDGNRYNTPKKRADEIVRMMEYTKDNPCYGFSKGAVKVLCVAGADTADLDGMPSSAGANLAAPDNDSANGQAQDALDLRGGIEMRETGLYKKDQEGVVQLISDIAYKDVVVLLSLPAIDKPSELWGFEAEVLLQGKSKGRQQLDMQLFLSKQRYQEFALRNMGVMKGADNDVASLATILRDMGVKDGKVSYVTRREGLDYVVRPEAMPPVKDLIWVETSGVYGATAVPYIFRPQIPSGAVYQSDIYNAPELTGDAREKRFFEALFNLNDPSVVGPLLGWMTSCYHRMIYDALFQKFPLCQVWGEAGSGKTETTKIFGNMHFYSTEPMNFACSQLTPYYLQVHCSASASIPFILDEYKPREMKMSKMREALPNAFRSAYNNGVFGKGGEGEQIGQSWKSISKLTYSAPLVFIGEALESETAIMERTVSVPVSKSGIVGRSRHLRVVNEGKKILSSVGRSVLGASFGIDFSQFREIVEKNMLEASALFLPDTQHRVIYNLAVVLTGFDFFTSVLRTYFGASFDADLLRLRQAILTEPAAVSGTIMSEASKVMQSLAYMSQNEEALGHYGLRAGVDYAFVDQAGMLCLDMKTQTAWVKYSAWCRNKGQQPLYDNYEAMCQGLAHYAPTVDKTCLNSPIKDHALVKVYRFSLQKLADAGVPGFKGG